MDRTEETKRNMRGMAEIFSIFMTCEDSLDRAYKLYCASESNLLDVVEELVAHSTKNNPDRDLLERQFSGGTPLNVASQNGNIDIVRMLVGAGANIEARDLRQRTPLLCACNMGNYIIASFLVEQGADVNVQDEEGETPLHRASRCYDRNLATMNALISSHRCDVNKKSDDGNTPLHTLIQHNPTRNILECLLVLVTAGADINALNKTGDTPLLTLVKKCLFHMNLNMQVYQEIMMVSDPPTNDKLVEDTSDSLELFCSERCAEDIAKHTQLMYKMIEMGADPLINDELGKSALDHMKPIDDQAYDIALRTYVITRGKGAANALLLAYTRAKKLECPDWSPLQLISKDMLVDIVNIVYHSTLDGSDIIVEPEKTFVKMQSYNNDEPEEVVPIETVD
jgi:ankyrin repeat protein